jgi:hypothetical protein
MAPPVQLSFNGQDFSAPGSVNFTYYGTPTPPQLKIPELLSITPSYGTVVGGTTVTVRGLNFASALPFNYAFCYFGTERVAARFASAGAAIACRAPPAPSLLPATVPFAVSVFPSQLTNESVFYRFVGPTPSLDPPP